MTTRSHGLLDQVDDLIKLARSVPTAIPGNDGDLMQAHLVRYGCLLACAALEQALIDCLASYAGRIGDSRVQKFVSEILKTGRNPTRAYLKETISKFDLDWANHIDTVIDTIGPDKISSIVSNRNRIAHGENVSLGVRSLIEWTPAVRRLCLELASLTSIAHAEHRGPSRGPGRHSRRSQP